MKLTDPELALSHSASGGYSRNDSSEVVTQTGVQKVEAVAKTWTRKSLYIAYAGSVVKLRPPPACNPGP